MDKEDLIHTHTHTHTHTHVASLVAQMVNNHLQCYRLGFNPWYFIYIYIYIYTYTYIVLVVKNHLPAKAGNIRNIRDKRHGFGPWVRMTPWKRAWQPTPLFLPGYSYGHGSLAGYSPQGHKQLDMTEVT